MNHVFLSGIVEKAPMMVSKESEITHVTLELTVTHLNASGKEKREKYPPPLPCAQKTPDKGAAPPF